MTNPEPVESFTIESLSVDSALISWEIASGHSCLKGFNISCVSRDNKIKREVEVKHEPGKLTSSFLLDNLVPATEFTVEITAVCVYDKLETISSEETLQFITKPFPPHHLRMETQNCHSFSVTWDSQLFLG